MEFTDNLRNYAEQPITRQILLSLLKNYQRPNDKISELVKQGVLLQVKRSIYIPGAKLNISLPEPFLLANHLSGPSYISLDSALSHWSLIPERVYEISSITTNQSKSFKTPAGRFTYTHMKLPYYCCGIKQVELTKKQTVLMASVEKALCDKIITTAGILLRSEKQTMEFLLEDLRIDKAMLRNLDTITIKKWLKYAPKKNSLETLVKALDKL